MGELVGVFGGTFDPPHIGHLILADEARAALALDRVLWVVSGEPPHKPSRPITPVETRVEMVLAAILEAPEFELSRADIDRPGPHYSVDTIRWLQERYPGKGLAYLMGSDALMDLPNWHQPNLFVEVCSSIGVLRRPGTKPDLQLLERHLPGISAKVRYFKAPPIGISGRDIRGRVAAGEPYRYLVPSGVAALIKAHQLYG